MPFTEREIRKTEAALGAGYAQVDNCTKDLPTRTATSDVLETFLAVERLTDRIRRLTTQMCGPGPEDAGEDALPPQSSGLFPLIGVGARVSLRHINEAHEALDRIEREIP